MPSSTQTSPTYTIEQFVGEKSFPSGLIEFFQEAAKQVAKMYSDSFDWRNFTLMKYAQSARLMVCYKDDKPVGVMLYQTFPSVFDPETIVCKQDLLYVKKGNPRATKLLLDEFIDFGKANANHVITMIAEKTNIKPRSLEKLGFKKLEVLYRLES
jgi:hypothetical protein